MTGKPFEENKKNLIHEPLSSYYPPPFEVESPTIQNRAPEYRGHGGKYVRKKGAAGGEPGQKKES